MRQDIPSFARLRLSLGVSAIALISATSVTQAQTALPTIEVGHSVLSEHSSAPRRAAPPATATAPVARSAAPSQPSPLVAQQEERSLTVPSFQAQQQRFLRRPAAESVVGLARQDGGVKANLREYLELTPGVYASERGGENNTGVISIRGSDVTQTGPRGGRGVRFYIDGVPNGRIATGVTQYLLDLKAAEYMEVYRGAASLRYGALAMGGAINLISKNGFTAPGLRVSYSGGSFTNSFAQVEWGGVKGNWDWYIQGNNYADGGYENHSAFHAPRGSVNLGWRPTEDLETRLYVQSGATWQELSTSMPLPWVNIFRRSGYDPTNMSLPYNLRGNFDYTRVATKTVYRLNGDTVLEFSPYFVNTSFDHVPQVSSGIVDNKWTDAGAQFRLEHKTNIVGLPTEIVAGFRPTREWANYGRWLWAFGSAGNGRAVQVQNNHGASWWVEGYGEAAIEIAPKTRIFLGGQAFWTRFTQTDDYRGPAWPSYAVSQFPFGPGGPSASVTRLQNYAREYSSFNPKVGVNWEYFNNNFLYANIAKSTEAPNAGDTTDLVGVEKDLAGVGVAPGSLSSKLKLQQAWTGEFGLRGNLYDGRLQYDLALYHMTVDNELLSACATALLPAKVVSAIYKANPNSTVGSYQCGQRSSFVAFNVNNTVHNGIELALRTKPLVDVFTPGDAIFANLSYTFQSIHFWGDPTYGYNRMPVVPQQLFYAEGGYRHPLGLYLSANVRYVGNRKTTLDGSGGPNYVVSDYGLIGARLGWREPHDNWNVWFEARNLADVAFVGEAQAQATPNLRVNPFPNVYPGVGRAFYAGLSYRIDPEKPFSNNPLSIFK